MSNCRFCHTPLEHTLVDLGLSPVANAYVSSDDLEKGEGFYPLHTYVCQACFLLHGNTHCNIHDAFQHGTVCARTHANSTS